ncbi:glucuronyl hydrolase [Emticicia sp. CRIBPO]|uniref:glycoside hydrolase family 88 protein n=1 Tax=Emticicia sp. CRIBPO TaxID=2683258 RepID=UPI0014133878|nr:glycoside hydrolase family 88 protein [Emticicia sp. CRIBPO]NBA88447.1 glucuronyl hydrolase [Emticicia sp. CRIBPO]
MKISVLFLSLLILWGCSSEPEADVAWVDTQLQYCAAQAEKTLKLVPDSIPDIPRNVNSGGSQWRFVDYKDWTSGFWPGVLWYLYEDTQKEEFRQQADRFSRELTPLSEQPAYDHDLGFQMFNSFGNGYRLTGNPEYKSVVLKSSDVLATLFNAKAGTILSWPREVQKFGGHNTIIDNMINLEMLMWASKNGGEKKLADIALSHAETTMKNQFNEAFVTGHVVVYDTLTGKKIKRVTHQGLNDNSMWARGQSWAIYGYTMMYRETQKPEFLVFAQKVTDVYLKRLPEDLIPYWDFDDTHIPDAPRDASAAAVTASALLELSAYVKDQAKAAEYKTKAIGMLKELSSERYQSRDKNTAFLLHSTGHHPNGTEIDASIIYADYYYIEALLRLKRLLVK